jgi:tetrapyrrole methylase family protein/MazG family protein
METNNSHTRPEKKLGKLLDIMRQLRSPDGCMWDRQQKKEDIAGYLIDEAYEVIDAIESNSEDALKEELGDLLFQILFLARISEEAGHFGASDVIEAVTEKMIRRHPHVFGNNTVRDVDEIRKNWEDINRNVENKTKKKLSHILTDIPRSMPALLAAQKMTENVSKFGFDWDNAEEVLLKVDEELLELKNALKAGHRDAIKEEIGDLFLSLVNVCRFVDVNAEDSLKATIRKFGERFQHIEKMLATRGKTLTEASIEEMDDLWNQSKRLEGK